MSSDERPHAPRQSEEAPRNGLSGPGPDERPQPSGRRNSQGIRIDPEVEAEPSTRRTVLSTLVDHEPGVLAAVSGLFRRRQFNIESLTVGPTEDEDYARMTIVIEESEPGIEQAKKQLEKLVPVIAVTELDPDAIRRELALIKVDAEHPDKVQAVAEMYDGNAVDACSETVTVEITGTRQEVETAVEAFERFEIREIVRTGTTALERGARETADTPVADD